MDIEVRAVKAVRGWQWIAEGLALFRRSPLMWVAIVLALYVLLKIVLLVPLLGVAGLLLVPILLVGLMEGCRALEYGRELKPGYLLSGFVKNPAPLVTLGGISLVGNILVVMIIVALGGEHVNTMMKFAARPEAVTPETAKTLQEAVSRATFAALVGTTASLPLMMALWFAPLLVYYHDAKPLDSLRLSLLACWRNAGPFLLYGAVILFGLMIVAPISIAARQLDLGVALLGPLIVPSIYVSFKDVFSVREAPPPEPPPPPAAG
jgi:hypothetical protein